MDGRLSDIVAAQERKVAVDSLLAVAAQLQEAQPLLMEKLVARSDIPEHHSLDTFFQTVKAASDVRAARAMRPLHLVL